MVAGAYPRLLSGREPGPSSVVAMFSSATLASLDPGLPRGIEEREMVV